MTWIHRTWINRRRLHKEYRRGWAEAFLFNMGHFAVFALEDNEDEKMGCGSVSGTHDKSWCGSI
jgi:hypothetical protein